MVDKDKQKISISIGFGVIMTLAFIGIGVTIYQVYALPMPVYHGESSDNLIQLSTVRFLGPPVHEGGCHNPCLDQYKSGQICPLYCIAN